MALSFAFGGDTGTTYDDLKRRQAYAQAMWARGGQGSPKNAWEGLNSAAQSITGALLARKLGRELKGQQDEFGTMFNAALGGFGVQSASVPPRNPDQQIADDAMRSLGKTDQVGGGRDEFIAAMMPHAMRASEQTGLDPRLIIAQAAQETGWGKHAPGNNYFGIKSHGKSGGQNLATNEVVNGQTVRVNDSFRAYGGMGDSVDGYASFLQENPRYRAMLSAPDLDGQLAALGKSGYATDPNYAASVGNIARSIQVPQGQGGVTNPMLLSMISDPRASDAQRGVLQMLLQQQLQNADPMRKLQMQKLQAEIDATGKLTPYQRAQLEMAQARLDKPDPTSDQQNYQFYADQTKAAGQEPLPFNDWMLQSKRAGATTVNNVVGSEGSYDKEMGKNQAEKFIAIQDAAQASQSKIATLDALAGALDQASYTGFGADTALAMRRAGNAFGLDLGDTGPEEMAKALGNQLALQMRNPSGGAGMPGAMSDKDREFLVSSVPGIEKTPEGNRKLIEFSKKIEQRSIDVARLATEYANRNNGRLDYRFFDELAKWADANPLFSPAAPSAASPQPAPITSDEYKTLSDEELLRRLKEQ